jgi:hypothetical protein
MAAANTIGGDQSIVTSPHNPPNRTAQSTTVSPHVLVRVACLTVGGCQHQLSLAHARTVTDYPAGQARDKDVKS